MLLLVMLRPTGCHPERSERTLSHPRPANCLEGQRSFRRSAPQDDSGRHPERSERIALAPRRFARP